MKSDHHNASNGTLYLAKANDKGVCHCRCASAIISWPGQMSCPWCGCGWLFCCMQCRKAFTFATAVRIPQSMEELAICEFQRMWKRGPDAEQIRERVECMRELLEPVQSIGDEFVYLDGHVIPTKVDQSLRAGGAPLRLAGAHRDHILSRVPHLHAMESVHGFDILLGNDAYWGPDREFNDQVEAQS